MAKSKDFYLEMLLWSAKQAQESELDVVHDYCLRALVEAQETSYTTGNSVDVLNLIR